MPTICHIYVHIYSIQGATHTRSNKFVLFCHVVFMAQCIQMQLALCVSGKAKNQNRNQNQNRIRKATQQRTALDRQPKYSISAVAAAVGVAVAVAVANYMLTRTRKLITHLAQKISRAEKAVKELGEKKKVPRKVLEIFADSV